MTTSDETKELSPFLQRQSELMATRAAQDRSIEERQNYTLQPAAQEHAAKIDPNKLEIGKAD
jgi:hypothetical protein